MGVAVLSGMLESLKEARSRKTRCAVAQKLTGNSVLTNGNGVSVNRNMMNGVHVDGNEVYDDSDLTHPSRFIACVDRRESVVRLQGVFHSSSSDLEQGPTVEIASKHNLESVRGADIILLG